MIILNNSLAIGFDSMSALSAHSTETKEMKVQKKPDKQKPSKLMSLFDIEPLRDNILLFLEVPIFTHTVKNFEQEARMHLSGLTLMEIMVQDRPDFNDKKCLENYRDSMALRIIYLVLSGFYSINKLSQEQLSIFHHPQCNVNWVRCFYKSVILSNDIDLFKRVFRYIPNSCIKTLGFKSIIEYMAYNGNISQLQYILDLHIGLRQTNVDLVNCYYVGKMDNVVLICSRFPNELSSLFSKCFGLPKDTIDNRYTLSLREIKAYLKKDLFAIRGIFYSDFYSHVDLNKYVFYPYLFDTAAKIIKRMPSINPTCINDCIIHLVTYFNDNKKIYHKNVPFMISLLKNIVDSVSKPYRIPFSVINKIVNRDRNSFVLKYLEQYQPLTSKQLNALRCRNY
jgi:hypothetical protein